jgi:hypothetical protein
VLRRSLQLWYAQAGAGAGLRGTLQRVGQQQRAALLEATVAAWCEALGIVRRKKEQASMWVAAAPASARAAAAGLHCAGAAARAAADQPEGATLAALLRLGLGADAPRPACLCSADAAFAAMRKRRVLDAWLGHSHHSADLRQRLAGFLYAWQSNALGAALSSWRQYARWAAAGSSSCSNRPRPVSARSGGGRRPSAHTPPPPPQTQAQP